MQELTRNSSEALDESLEVPDTDPVNWRDHIIICGLHNLGWRIIEELRATGVRLVVVDDHPDPEMVEQIGQRGIRFVQDKSIKPDTLHGVGIENALALIICQEQDLQSLEIVLMAKELTEQTRIVVSLSNQKLSQQLTETVPNIIALSLAEKATSSFVEACVSSSVLDLFNIAGYDMAVAEAEVRQSGSVQRLFGTATPLFIREDKSLNPSKNDTVKYRICPPCDVEVQPGQVVVLAGRIEELRKLPGIRLDQQDVVKTLASREAIQPGTTVSRVKPLKHSPRQRIATSWHKLIGGLFSAIERPFRYALLFVGLVIILSTLILWVFYRNPATDAQGRPLDFSLLDALYFAVTVITSVGFGDYNFSQQNWGLKLFGIFLILVGVAATSILYGFVANFIVSRRIEQMLGRYRATEMEDHVIVCGLGTIGYPVVQGLLRQGKQVVVIEKNERGEFNNIVRHQGVPIIYGNAKLAELLRMAHIQRARAIAILTSDDLVNVETALTARAEYKNNRHNRRQNHKLQVVLRLFDEELADRVAKTFDIKIAYSTAALAAPYFVGAALDYEVISTFYVERRPFIVAKLVIKRGSGLDGLTVQQFYDKCQMWVTAFISAGNATPAKNGTHSEPIFYPEAEASLQGGDTIYFIGSSEYIVKAYRLNKSSYSGVSGS
jgi:Trk K+ transport system NAD-binding subunit